MSVTDSNRTQQCKDMGLFSSIITRSSFEKGQEMFRKKQFSRAAEYYLKAIEADEKPAVAAFELGLCYEQLGQLREAERSLRVAAKGNPSNSKAWELLSLTQCRLGMLREAESSAKTALESSIDVEQVFMSRMALVQALVCQLETCGCHHHQPDITSEGFQKNLEDLSARMSLQDRLAPEFRELIKVKPGFDEVWKLVALAGIYIIEQEWMPEGMRRLRDLRSPYFEVLKHEFARLHGYSFKEAYLDK